MKIFCLHTGLALTTALLVCQTMANEIALVTANVLNVRGQPTISSEVVTQLEKGERVIVLESLTNSPAIDGAPLKWARIQMPANTPVWVFAEFVDPAAHTVTVDRLNVRSGPGENFSVVGLVEEGDELEQIRTVGPWMEIAPPDGAYAFVAAEFLENVADGEAKETMPMIPPGGDRIAERSSKPPDSPKVQETQGTEETQEAQETQEISEAPAEEEIQPIIDPENQRPEETPPLEEAKAEEESPDRQPLQLAPPPSSPPGIPSISDEPVAVEESAPQPRRIVRREGVVRSTISIQAPTYFELISPETRRTINYLHTSSPEINLKDYRGREVVVTGEEGIDSRWPKTPVIEVETLEIAP